MSVVMLFIALNNMKQVDTAMAERGHITSRIAPFPGESRPPHRTHGSLDPHESTTETPCRAHGRHQQTHRQTTLHL